MKKNLPILENIEIQSVAAEGKAVARLDDKVIFVPYVVPGDVVDLQDMADYIVKKTNAVLFDDSKFKRCLKLLGEDNARA